MDDIQIGPSCPLFLTAIATMGFSGSVSADGHQVVDSIHFLIPGGAGGGWDGTRAWNWRSTHRSRSCRFSIV